MQPANTHDTFSAMSSLHVSDFNFYYFFEKEINKQKLYWKRVCVCATRARASKREGYQFYWPTEYNFARMEHLCAIMSEKYRFVSPQTCPPKKNHLNKQSNSRRRDVLKPLFSWTIRDHPNDRKCKFKFLFGM